MKCITYGQGQPSLTKESSSNACSFRGFAVDGMVGVVMTILLMLWHWW
jgi:hypothetical protein